MKSILPRVYRSLYQPSHATTGMRRLSTRAAGASSITPRLHKNQSNVKTYINYNSQVRTGQALVQTQHRTFTASNQQFTKAIFNPRKDENGQDMIIEIMPRASNRLHAIATKDSNPALALRVAVESGGCHGFQYLMSLTSTDDVSKEEDTIFESEDGKGAKVVMDEPSLELLKGSKIDYTMELIGSQFKVTGIPGATSSCGCGSSFDIQA
ncbi:hypothetical protein MBLNU459_g2946t1 [Dothideomycetes sp. NU459]